MNYPGGKNGGGAYQKIISEMPPHDFYIEPFVGGGAVVSHKLPALVQTVVIDKDSGVVDKYRCGRRRRDLVAICGCGIEYLKNYEGWTPRHMIYCDPTYLISSRRQRSRIYLHEMTDEQHRELLATLLKISDFGVKIIISGYYTRMYASALKGWRKIHYPMMTRGGKLATEWLWINYPPPLELHDYRYFGGDRTERQRIKRKCKRWVLNLEAMPLLERQMVLSAVTVLCSDQAGGMPDGYIRLGNAMRDNDGNNHTLRQAIDAVSWLTTAEMIELRQWLDTRIPRQPFIEAINKWADGQAKKKKREVVKGSQRLIQGVCYQQERVRCGNPRCRSCPHGPYWYVYFRVDGKQRSKYIGKELKIDGGDKKGSKANGHAVE